MLDNGLGLHMQVMHQGIAVPTTNHLDKVLIDFAAEEYNGATCA
jgi:hypothetical protein